MRNNFIHSILLLSLMVTFAAAAMPAQVQIMKEYNWLLDIIVIWIDITAVALMTPLWWFLSFFVNCQSCYIDMVVTIFDYLPLSYNYL